MRSYIVTTGAAFGLLVLLHLWRLIAEGPSLARDPWFWIVTGAAASFSIWAWRLVGMARRP